MSKIAITGIGIISPIGIGWESFSQSLERECPGFVPLTLFDYSSSPLVGQIADFDPKPFLGNKGIRHFDRTSLLVTSAAKMALDNAGWNEYSQEEAGVVLGSTYGSIDSIAAFDAVALEEGVNYVNPMSFPNTVINAPASRISIACNAKGLCSTISTGEGSALDALIYAAEFLSWDRARFLLTGGGYGIGPLTLWGLSESGFLGSAEEPPRTFGKDRKGAVLGEGACMLVLERAEDAIKRDRGALMYLDGFASGFSPLEDETGFVSKGAWVVEQAIDNAGISKESVSCVLAHAAGDLLRDRLEALILEKVFNNNPIAVTTLKGYTGECLDASGSFSLAAALYSLKNKQLIPVSGDYETGDDCPVELVGEKREMPGSHILIIGFSYTGNFSAIVVSHP
jgi:3-oxoacyl-[acyl-carrier-protein] synthase II